MITAYRQHRCDRTHRNERSFLNCAIPSAAWVMGRGRFAVIAWCGIPTITLWPTASDASKALQQVDGAGCGGRCCGRHHLIEVVLEWQVKR